MKRIYSLIISIFCMIMLMICMFQMIITIMYVRQVFLIIYLTFWSLFYSINFTHFFIKYLDDINEK